MPTYEYRCKDCGHEFEIVQAFTDDPLAECPSCDGALRKKFAAPGISFKGSGFYKTDSRGGSKATTPASTESSSDSTSADSTSSDSTSSGSGSSGDKASSDSGSGSSTGGSSDSGTSSPTTSSSGGSSKEAASA